MREEREGGRMKSVLIIVGTIAGTVAVMLLLASVAITRAGRKI